MQSENYVPGVSGWKIDTVTGAFELHSDLNSVRGTDADAVYCGRSRDGKPIPVVLTNGELSQAPQMVTITAAEWAEWDMPANALERYKLIGDAVNQIPSDYRDSAEFSTEDHSYDRDGSDIRTTLTYSRSETVAEAAARAERAKVAGTKVSITNDCMTVIQDGVVRVQIGKMDEPFVVEADQVFLKSAMVRDGVIESEKLPEDWRVNMKLNARGYPVVAGIGLGSQILVSADKFAIKEEQPKSMIELAIAGGDAQKVLDLLACQISESEIAQGMKEQDEQFAKRIRKVIVDELRPGGMLHRFNR
ncbi:DUF1983 domain-containing protein [Pseudomonas sp. GD03842]|uniref:phage tail tip fiber protein n=1 Tax=Pseudomonas sp. GD03842 TaxID=2975385 RepID=UPI00244C59C9|nr:hypothetical protein [Pseudomonas sp. GD03842]MDH0745749.1 DUF1983 domain-containing protein [Pseudomonas sp. GD03842]